MCVYMPVFVAAIRPVVLEWSWTRVRARLPLCWTCTWIWTARTRTWTQDLLSN